MIHIVTGGSGSGKSAYAEDWLTGSGKEKERGARGDAPFLYIAAMRPYTEEVRKKIERHQSMRAGKGFATIERYTDLKELEIPKNDGILLECVSNLAANELYGEEGKRKDWREALEEITAGVRHLAANTPRLAVVTNEVNADINGYSGETEIYRKLLGEVNQRLAGLADQVTEVVYGIPVLIKGNE